MGLLASNMMSKESGSDHLQCHNTKKKILDKVKTNSSFESIR